MAAAQRPGATAVAVRRDRVSENRWDNLENTDWDSMGRLAKVRHDKLLRMVVCIAPPRVTAVPDVQSYTARSRMSCARARPLACLLGRDNTSATVRFCPDSRTSSHIEILTTGTPTTKGDRSFTKS
jgi:hypothetical protein